MKPREVQEGRGGKLRPDRVVDGVVERPEGQSNYGLGRVVNVWLDLFFLYFYVRYLDRPMRNHTLMQTIARANRVFPEKENGLIVDYVGVFRRLG